MQGDFIPAVACGFSGGGLSHFPNGKGGKTPVEVVGERGPSASWKGLILDDVGMSLDAYCSFVSYFFMFFLSSCLICFFLIIFLVFFAGSHFDQEYFNLIESTL